MTISSDQVHTEADLTGGHSCSGQRGPWEAGWALEAPGPLGSGRLNFELQLQSPDYNLN